MTSKLPGSNRNLRRTPQWPVRDTILLSLALACGVVFAVLTVQAARGEFLAIDATVHTTLAGWQHPFLTTAMQTVTVFGGMPWLLPLMGLVMLLVWQVYGLRILLRWSGYTLVIAALFQGIRFMDTQCNSQVIMSRGDHGESNP